MILAKRVYRYIYRDTRGIYRSASSYIYDRIDRVPWLRRMKEGQRRASPYIRKTKMLTKPCVNTTMILNAATCTAVVYLLTCPLTCSGGGRYAVGDSSRESNNSSILHIAATRPQATRINQLMIRTPAVFSRLVLVATGFIFFVDFLFCRS